MKRIPELTELFSDAVSSKHEQKHYWRSLEQYADTPEFKAYLAQEFPEGISELKDPISRRRFLSIMGASLALAGLAACRRPVEKIVPYVKAPEEITPGIAQQYATVMPVGLTAYGLVVTSHEGRPTKIEGNKSHPTSFGGTNFFAQAEILSLYDPDRSQRILKKGVEAKWSDFTDFWVNHALDYRQRSGDGLALVMSPFHSPSLASALTQFKSAFPKAIIASYDPVCDESVIEGLSVAFGTTESMLPVYDLKSARVILSIESDFCQKDPENVVLSRGFIEGRRVAKESDTMNRLYSVESAYTITGGMADHRLRLRPSELPAFTIALAKALSGLGVAIPAISELPTGLASIDETFVTAVAKDLVANKGAGAILAGRELPKEVHALVASLNTALSNTGATVSYHPLHHSLTPKCDGLSAVVNGLNSGSLQTVIVLGVNPVYDAPADLNFSAALKKASHVIHCGYYDDETAAYSTWHLPLSHFLESWGDAASSNGTLSIIQPLIEPLFKTKSILELLSFFGTLDQKSGYEVLREVWRGRLTGDFESQWRRALHDGMLAGSSSTPFTGSISTQHLAECYKASSLSPFTVSESALEIVFTASATLYDGRYSNNAWLQELPDPITKITWDNAALISEKTAKTLGLKTVYTLSDYQKREVVKISYGGRSIEIPVWVTPGHPDYTITLPLGYGRARVGRVGNGVGVNTYALRQSKAQYNDSGASISKTGRTFLLASTQHEGDMHGRPVVIEATLNEYQKNPDFVEDAQVKSPKVQLWEKPYKHDDGYQWGMVIDLNACTGCNACAIACQSENNIPVVGKEQVARSRQMHWIRIDRYFAGDVENPQMVTQPVACQHCENAPCESVCPVAATVHDEEGLNSMVYNRCVGTRYCANNCPYKVRRFNYFNYATDSEVWNGEMPELVKMAQNPDVTVRFRGVMEKCTYCTQRINSVKITAKNEGREVVDGEIVTACQQVCPTEAIVFGNINDPNSKVSEMKRYNRDYQMLAEINVKPRTSYLAKLRNPNPELETSRVS